MWTTIDRLMLIVALLGAAFNVGYNYRGLDAMHTELVGVRKDVTEGFIDVKANYVRQDVTKETQQRIDEQLVEIRMQLDRIEQRSRAPK